MHKRMLAITTLMIVTFFGRSVSWSQTSSFDVIETNDVRTKAPIADPRAWGAIANDGSSDRSALQNALESGATHVLIPDGTFDVAVDDEPLVVPQGVTVFGSSGATIRCTLAAQSCFLIQQDDVALEGFRIQGPGSDEYLNNQHGINIKGAANRYVKRTTLDRLRISGFGDSAVWSQFVDGLQVTNNHISEIGRSGVMVLSGTNSKVNFNTIRNIKPGAGGNAPFINAYGIAFTREKGTLSEHPQSRRCEAIGNQIENVPSYEALDTHGGYDLIFANNIVRDCAYGIVVTHADNDDSSVIASATRIIIANNILVAGENIQTNAGISITPMGAGARGSGIIITGNHVNGYGANVRPEYSETPVAKKPRGAIHVRNVDSSIISNNAILSSHFAAIDLTDTQVGTIVSGNSILNVDPYDATNSGIRVASGTVQVTIDNNTFFRSKGALDAFDFVDNSPTFGVTLGCNNTMFGVTKEFKGRSREYPVVFCHKIKRRQRL